MNLLPTEEQQQIIDTAKHFLDSEFPVSDALALEPGASRVQRPHLEQIAQLGWFGIGLDDACGGVGYGASEETLLYMELGRSLMPPSLLGASLGARIAAAAGHDAQCSAILAGSARVALGVARNTAVPVIGERVSGEFIGFEGQDSDYLLLAGADSAALVDTQALSEIGATECIDPTLTSTVYSADGVGASAWLASEQEDIFHRGALLSAALQAGIAQATLERSVDHAQEREQYGKPIGSFQAIKHYCADMAIRCESVRAMLYYASVTLQNRDESALLDVQTAKTLADDAAVRNANCAVQVHGGMGFTQEMDIHLFVKRAQVLSTLFGGRRHHLRALLSQARPA